MSLLSKLFGSGPKAPSKPAAIEYGEFRIYPEPVAEDGGFRLAARIEMGEGSEIRTHHLIRADVIRDRDQAAEAAVAKARQMIDQMGVRLFG